MSAFGGKRPVGGKTSAGIANRKMVWIDGIFFIFYAVRGYHDRGDVLLQCGSAGPSGNRRVFESLGEGISALSCCSISGIFPVEAMGGTHQLETGAAERRVEQEESLCIRTYVINIA